MAGKLQKEIKQTTPFPRPEAEAILNIAKTADVIDQALTAVLKDYGLSATQYNVLRILRGAGDSGLACGEICGRMITHDPDMTRLLDRLEKRILVTRGRDREDRRVITTRITAEGVALLQRLDSPLDELLDRLLGHIGQRKLATLIDLLEEVRANVS